MPFPSQVNATPAIGIEGDFASSNPRSHVLAGPGALVAGAGGVTAGRFAWIDSNAMTAVNTGTGAPAGLVHRDMTALIVTYLGESSMVTPEGFPTTVYDRVDMFVKNTGMGAVALGAQAYATLADGTVTFAANGSLNVATPFFAKSVGAAGDLIMIGR